MVKLLMLPSSDSSNSNSSEEESTSPTSPNSPLAPPPAQPAFYPHHLYPPPPPHYSHPHHEKPMVFNQSFPFPAANPIPNPTCYHYSPPSFPHFPQKQQHQAAYNFFPQEQTPPPFYHPQTPPCVADFESQFGPHSAVIRGPRSGNGYWGTGVWREWVVKSYPRKPVQSFRNGKWNGGNGNGGNGKGYGEGNKVWKLKDEKKGGMIKANNNNKKKKKKNERVWSEKKSGSSSSSTTSLPTELANCTTIMVKNIPNNISRDEFMKLLDNHCREQNGKQDNNDSCQSQYDFLYLPFDFRREQNLGYAFVNFTTVEGVSRLYTCWNNKGWNCDSPKICVITRAKLQGVEQCRRHFKISVFICNAKEFLPVEFSPPRNGLNCNSSEAKTIGKWVFANRSCVKRGGSAKTIHPPRLNRATN